MPPDSARVALATAAGRLGGAPTGTELAVVGVSRRRGNRRLQRLEDLDELRSTFLRAFEPALDYATACVGTASVQWDAAQHAEHAYELLTPISLR